MKENTKHEEREGKEKKEKQVKMTREKIDNKNRI